MRVLVYVNENPVDNEASTGSVTQNDNNLYFGKWPGGGQNDFNGLIDEVRIYSVALTSVQIQKLYAEGAKKRGLLAEK